MMAIWEDGKTISEWFRILAACGRTHPDGFFWRQFIDHFTASGEEFDGQILDVTDDVQIERFDGAVRTSLSVLQTGGLLLLRQQIPPRAEPAGKLRLRLLPEACITVTPRGQRILGWSERNQAIFVAYAVARVQAVSLIARMKVPIAVLSFGFSVLKLVFQWNSISAGLVAAFAAALAAITIALSPSH